MDYREAELAAKMLIDGISENLKNGKNTQTGAGGGNNNPPSGELEG